MLAVLVAVFGCTKKNNLTGTNWSDLEAQIIQDENALISGYSFPADSLDSILTNRKALLVGRWNGSEARSILRFTNLPADSTIQNLHDLSNLNLELVLLRSSEHTANPIRLQFFKVNAEYQANPFDIAAEDLAEITQAAVTLDHTVISSDTLRIALPYSLLQNWQANADSTGLNIMIKASDEAGFADGFAEIRLSSGTIGSKISYDFKENSSDEAFSSFSRYAAKNDYFLTHQDAPVVPGEWKISNYQPQRIYVDLQPDMTAYRDKNGNQLNPADLKRVSINKAELVLHIKKDQPSLRNAISYDFSPLLIKARPESPQVILTTDMFRPQFFMTLFNITSFTADSLVVDITPIIQAYVSEKTFADGTLITPEGIVLMSKFERKDFGEIEFFHPLSAPADKKPFIRIKYTPPFL
jgi:hypothetical protein